MHPLFLCEQLALRREKVLEVGKPKISFPLEHCVLLVTDASMTSGVSEKLQTLQFLSAVSEALCGCHAQEVTSKLHVFKTALEEQCMESLWRE
eukprot:COSAG06_NODE_27547_length_591_cov_0.867886_1_plen_93_part_10